jgi:uncharacterized protein (UPF0261 family)
MWNLLVLEMGVEQVMLPTVARKNVDLYIKDASDVVLIVIVTNRYTN